MRFLNRKQKVFGSIVGVLLYCMMLFPTFNSIGLSAMKSAAMKSADENVKMSKKEKEKLVEQGVAQYEEGDHSQAKKTLEHAKEVFPANYAVPYYLGLIYLEEGRRSDAIAELQQYVLMDPKSEDSLKIRKYLTLLIREEAVEYAKQAANNEAALLRGPVADNTMAVTAFKNLGSENLGPLGKGMAAMLIHDLSQVPDLKIVERVKLQALLQEMNLGTSGLVDQETAPKVGKLLKAKHVTTGSLADLEKENLQITSVVVDAEHMASIGTQEAQGALKKFYDLEKEIACDIIEDLGHDCEKMPGAFGKVHTKSLPALTSFSVGLDYLDQEQYDEAREAFQKALDEDPKFELAEEALLATPLSAMLAMTTSQTISGLSASGVSSTAAGSAVVGGVGIVTTTTTIAGVVALAGGAAAAAGGGGGGGGGGSGGSEDNELNLTGDWIGTWTDSSGLSGNLSLTLTQTNTSVSGTVSITGHECISTGTLSGTITGDNLVFVIETGTDTASFNANCTSTSINGTFEIMSGSCAGDIGNFSTSTNGNAIIEW